MSDRRGTRRGSEHPAGLLLDFDGVILDTETPLLKAWDIVLLQLDRRPPSSEDIERCLGGSYEDLDRLFRDALGSAPEVGAATARRRALTADFLASEAIRPGVEDWLADAAALSVPVAVVSSSPTRWVEPHLERLRVADRVSYVVCVDQGRAPKPAPDLYLAAAEMIGVSAHVCIAVEDTANGIESAIAAGVGIVVGVRLRPGSMADLSRATVMTESLDMVSFEGLLDLAAHRPDSGYKTVDLPLADRVDGGGFI